MARKSRWNVAAEEPKTTRPTLWDTWIYGRISTENEKNEDSIDNQIAIAKEHISGKSDLIFRGAFTDSGFSGTNFDRPDYERMMAGIYSGEVRCVVVKDLSRLGRTYIEVGELLFDTFIRYGVRFISVNDQYDSGHEDADRKKLLILFKNLVNHMYSKDLGKKIRSAHAAKKRRGEPTGLPPYGYRKSTDGKRLAVDQEAATVVKMIFDMRLQGESTNQIAKYLNREQIPSPQHRRYQLGEIAHEKFANRIVWPATMVSKLLRNETYTGSLIQGKYDCNGKKHNLLPREQWIVHENAHPAIVSKEQFDEVAQLMQETAEKYQSKGQNPMVENHYAGKIICSRCGKTAVRCDGGGPGRVLHYYCCRACNDELKNEHNLKTAPKLPLNKLDAILTDTLRRHMDTLIHFDDLAEVLSKSEPLQQKKALLTKEKRKCEKTIADADKNLSSAYIHHLDGLLDFREYQAIRTKVEYDKAQAEAALAHIAEEERKYNIQSIAKNQWLAKYNNFRDFETPTRELIQALVKRIVLTPLTNEIEIELNYMDCFADLQNILIEIGVEINEQIPDGHSV